MLKKHLYTQFKNLSRTATDKSLTINLSFKKILKYGSVSIFMLFSFLSFTAPVQAGGYTDTRYPIVLVHGLAGFDDIGDVIQYFNGIPRALERSGTDVHVVQVSAANSSEVRGEQLLAQVEEIIAVTGAKKVNLIGHSHGSMTARYVAGVKPSLVASVTSVGGVNWGSAVADNIDGDNQLLETASNAFFSLVDLLSAGGFQQDSVAALNSLSTAGSIAFNQKFPAGIPSSYCANDGAHKVNGVSYYSWGGSSTLTNIFDPSDYLLSLTSLAFGEPNDGLTSRCSQQLGKVISTNYNMNHLDEVNQVAGLTAIFSTDPVSLFRQHANRLKRAGL
ncbi:MAG: lipase family alpha/beta hydrolase [Cellvibrionaceae bacterium]